MEPQELLKFLIAKIKSGELKAINENWKRKYVEMNYGHGLTSVSRFDKDNYCAMGADDRYRWELCDCEPCKINGVTRIKH